jgi:3D (Asp-Asp-Asp) domain-containing protein
MKVFLFLSFILVSSLVGYDFIKYTEELEIQTQWNKHEITLLQQKVIKLQQIINEVSNITVKATAYNAVAEQTDSDPNITACLTKPTIGSVAVSQDLYFKGWTCGKKIHIKGLGVFIIKDVMHYRKTKQIDILIETIEEALNFAVVNDLNAVLLSNYEKM